MPAMTKAELIKENERLPKCVTSLERAAKQRAEEPKDSRRLRAALTEALEQQTATSEILRVISSSLTDVHSVFDAIVRSAHRLMDGRTATVLRIVDGQLHIGALTSTDDTADSAVRSNFPSWPIASWPQPTCYGHGSPISSPTWKLILLLGRGCGDALVAEILEVASE